MCLLCQRTANSYGVCAWCPLLVYVFFMKGLKVWLVLKYFVTTYQDTFFALPWYVFIALRAFHLFYLTAAAQGQHHRADYRFCVIFRAHSGSATLKPVIRARAV